LESLSCRDGPPTSEAGLKVRTGFLGASSGPSPPIPDLVSQASDLSASGVPAGVLLALSTRLCLELDRGVTLLLRKAETGDIKSSRLLEVARLEDDF
jgi:hypothetical protein